MLINDNVVVVTSYLLFLDVG